MHFSSNNDEHKNDEKNNVGNDNLKKKTLYETSFETCIMNPLSEFLNPEADFYHFAVNENSKRKQLDYIRLEWLFDFGDIPAFSVLNFWCDVILGLKVSMSLNVDITDESVLILEWNQNWSNRFIQPNIVHSNINANKKTVIPTITSSTISI